MSGTRRSWRARRVMITTIESSGGAEGARVVTPARLWHDKVLRDHPELEPHLADVLRAVAEPDHIALIPSMSNAAATTCEALAQAAGWRWS